VRQVWKGDEGGEHRIGKAHAPLFCRSTLTDLHMRYSSPLCTEGHKDHMSQRTANYSSVKCGACGLITDSGASLSATQIIEFIPTQLLNPNFRRTPDFREGELQTRDRYLKCRVTETSRQHLPPRPRFTILEVPHALSKTESHAGSAALIGNMFFSLKMIGKADIPEGTPFGQILMQVG